MLQILVNPQFDFVRWRRWAYVISAVAILIGLAHITYSGGLRYGIDFSGGTLLQVRFERPTTVDDVRAALARVQAGESIIQGFGDAQEYLIRVPVGSHTLEEISKRIDGGLRQAGLPGFEVRRLEFVGPQVGRDLQWDAVQAVLWGMVGILIYTAMRFDFKGGVAAILALLHDVVIALGAMSIAHREMSLPVLAALLTIVGFSINDTIVTFDRIRENRGRGLRRGETLGDVINAAINQTLSRTILTSLTVFLVVVVLFIFGGEVLRDFAFVLLVGVIAGTYSTIFVAAPIILDWENWSQAGQRGGKKTVVKAGAGR
ncbi:MAG TPA: protein translocase subunit SecF [Methylomirabilota bacterium]|jgi:preprotein translocase SecF subunit|nr:protein translocase subunit SecF [Methylomirabilota bacterium]